MTDFLVRRFVKDYQNVGSHPVRERYGKLAGMVGIATNLLLFLLKLAVGLLSGSVAITADAVNNLSDSASSLVTVIGFKISGKPADERHPYGHARMEYVSGLIVSVLVLFLGLQLAKDSIDKILNPQEAQFGAITFAVLAGSIALKLWQSLFYKNIAKRIDSVALLAAATDSRSDILGTSAVLAAAAITRLSGFNLDGYMGLLVALFILVSGGKLVSDTVSPLLGTAPTRELVDEIYRKILSYDGIIGLHDLTVHSYGPSKRFASVHCEVPAEQDIMISHDIIDNIERDFRQNENIQLVIHLDPVVTGDERTSALKIRVEALIGEFSPRISMHDFRVVWGKTHTNLIFDVIAPYDAPWSDAELRELISQRISGLDASYNAVVTVDHNYVPEDQK